MAGKSTSRNSSNSRRGLTLLELILVLAIVVIVSAMAVPRLMGSARRRELAAGAISVQASLNRARSGAMRSGRTLLFLFQPQSRAFAVAAAPIDSETQAKFDFVQQMVTQQGALTEQQLAGLDGVDAAQCSMLPADIEFVSFQETARTAGTVIGLPGVTGAQSVAASSPYGNGEGSFGGIGGNGIGGNGVGGGQSGFIGNGGYGQQNQAGGNAGGFGTGTGGSSTTEPLPYIVFYPDGTCESAFFMIKDDEGNRVAIAVRSLTGQIRLSEIASEDGTIVMSGRP